MKTITRFFALSLLLCLLALVRRAAPSLPDTIPHDRLREARDCGNAESRFAFGETVSIERTGLYELTLISGISDQLAGEIIESKRRILANAFSKAPGRRSESLEIVHGIAEKKADALSRYLSIEAEPSNGCPVKTPTWEALSRTTLRR